MSGVTASPSVPSLFLPSIIIRLSAASISFLSSTAMATCIMAVWMREGKSTPHSRIIFGLSVADMIQSFSITIGPFTAPKDTPQALWAVGNTRSCEIQGFFLSASAVAIPMYVFLLIVYYLKRAKYGMSRKAFTKKIERAGHAFILLWNIVGNLYALFNGYINATRFGTTCKIRSYPLYCEIDPENFGECTRGGSNVVILLDIILLYLPAFVGIFGAIVCLGMLSWHVFAERAMRRNNNDGVPRPSDFSSLHGNSYQKDMLVQSCLYTFALLFVYSSLYINLGFIVSGHSLPTLSHILVSFTWPIGGLIHILIYTRPKIIIMRTRRPELTWIRAFYKVILAGAEVPNEPASDALTSFNSLRTNRQQNADLELEGGANVEKIGDVKEDLAAPGSDDSALKSFLDRPRQERINTSSNDESSRLAASEFLWSEQIMMNSECNKSTVEEINLNRRFYG